MQTGRPLAPLDESQERAANSLKLRLPTVPSVGGIYHHFTTGTLGTAAANCQYITREPATGGDPKNVHLHNYPEYIRGDTYDELRQNIIEYNRQREQDELNRARRGGGVTRTHYRIKLSFEGQVDTNKAREMAARYLRENFPKARAVVAIHQDTEHTHAHINVQARDIEGKKISLSRDDYTRLDERWGRVYASEFGEEKLQDHLAKKQETREYKRAKARGEQAERPARADRKITKDDHREREMRNYGDETRIGRNQRAVADAARRGGRGESHAERFAEGKRQATAAAHGAIRETENLRGDLARLGERSVERGEGKVRR